MLKSVPRCSFSKGWNNLASGTVSTSYLNKTSHLVAPKIFASTSNTIKSNSLWSTIRLTDKLSHKTRVIAVDVTFIKSKQPFNLFSTLKSKKSSGLNISISCNNICHHFVAEEGSSGHHRNQKRYYNLPSSPASSWLSSWVRRAQSDPSRAVLMLLILLNLLVFLLWNTYGESTRKGRQFMFDNFTASVRNLLQGRVWTLVTSCMSQRDLLHFGVNMFVLWSAGSALISVLGVRRFLTIYFLGGMSSSLFALANNLYIQKDYPTHGASGSVSAIITIWGCMFPYSQVQVMFFPVPAIGAVGLFILWDLFHAMHGGTNISHVGHLGGNIFGFLYYFIRGPRIGL
mmetsp:Transcript_28902/g.40690  ORF Transcript_28902/g.40690 Transcript_28902/m.40690 type:complete len:343 (-) Transcript_28902:34-1062(-)